MADITKRAGSDDCDAGERGKRGHRGYRGEPGPGGPATSLDGPTSGPGALVGDEDIPAGFVVSGDGSAVLAVAVDSKESRVPTSALISITCPDDIRCGCTWNPFTNPPTKICPKNAIGVASIQTSAGQVARYVAAGQVTLPASTWDAATGGSGGLVPHTVYYLSQTTPGHLIAVRPSSGQAVKIGIALTPEVFDVQIESGQIDGLTIISDGTSIPGAFSATGYGFASGRDFEGNSDRAWQLSTAGILPGTPIFKTLLDGTNVVGQQSASAAAWLSSHVIGLSTPGLGQFGGIEQGKFISGGLFEMTEAQWNAVWTETDPNRGVGSGLLPGYPYYLSDVPGTFFLINTNGVPVVGPGTWITKCFVALSPTMALIQIGDPRLNGSS